MRRFCAVVNILCKFKTVLLVSVLLICSIRWAVSMLSRCHSSYHVENRPKSSCKLLRYADSNQMNHKSHSTLCKIHLYTYTHAHKRTQTYLIFDDSFAWNNIPNYALNHVYNPLSFGFCYRKRWKFVCCTRVVRRERKRNTDRAIHIKTNIQRSSVCVSSVFPLLIHLSMHF